MSWYRGYMTESVLYGSHASTSLGQATPALRKQQQYTAVDTEGTTAEQAELQPERLEAQEEETFFSFKELVNNRFNQPNSQGMYASPDNAHSTGAPSSDNNSVRPLTSPDTKRSNGATISSLSDPRKALQQSRVLHHSAVGGVRMNASVHEVAVVQDQQLPREQALQLRPAASGTPEQSPQPLLRFHPASAPECQASGVDDPTGNPSSSTSVTDGPVEVELQHRGYNSSHREIVHGRHDGSPYDQSESDNQPGQSYTDPLLHWSDCWAGAGLRHRATAAVRQQSDSSAHPAAISCFASPAREPPAPSHQQQHPRPSHKLPPAVGGHRTASTKTMPNAAGQAATLRQSRSTASACHQPPPPPQQQQQPHLCLLARTPSRNRHWWLLGGVGLAALSGCAVFAVFGVMSYMMKAAMVYSLAWKAATGVAAAEGLALGGWSVRSARASKAAMAAAAEELARVRERAVTELNALQAMLQQQGAAHGQEVSQLTKVNEKLKRLAHNLTTENASLQSALQQAAAERKALEAAAALENSRAETSAVAAVAAAQGDRVLGEVEALSAQQQQLMALVFELREDLLGLVAAGDEQAATELIGESSETSTSQRLDINQDQAQAQDTDPALAEHSASKCKALIHAAGAAAAAPAGEEQGEGEDRLSKAVHRQACLADCTSEGGCKGTSTTVAVGDMPVSVAADTNKGATCLAEASSSRSAGSGSCDLSKVQCIRSVRDGVNAAMAAAVAHTLEL